MSEQEKDLRAVAGLLELANLNWGLAIAELKDAQADLKESLDGIIEARRDLDYIEREQKETD